MVGAQVPAAPCVGASSQLLAALVQAASASRLDEGNDVLGGPSASSLALFPSVFYWAPDLFKENSYITLLPITLQWHLEKCKP